jgi:hypothetical protein
MKHNLLLLSTIIILFLTACNKSQPSLKLPSDQDWDALPLQEFKLPTNYLLEDDRRASIKMLNETTYVLTRRIGGNETLMKIISGKKVLNEKTLFNFYPFQTPSETPYFYYQTRDEDTNHYYLGIIDPNGLITKKGPYKSIKPLKDNYQDLVIELEPIDSPNLFYQIIDPMTNELILDHESSPGYTFKTLHNRDLYFENVMKTSATKTGPEEITTFIKIVGPEKVHPLTFNNEVSYVRHTDSIGIIEEINKANNLKKIHEYKNGRLYSSEPLQFIRSIDLHRENAYFLLDTYHLIKLNHNLEVVAEQTLTHPLNPINVYTYPNHLYVITDTDNQKLMKFDYNLNPAGEVPMGPNAHRLIHVDEENHVYVQVENGKSETGMTTHIYDENSKYLYSVEAALSIDIAPSSIRFKKIQNNQVFIYNLKEEQLLTTSPYLTHYALNESIVYTINPIDTEEDTYKMTIVNYDDGKLIKELEIGTSSIDYNETYGDYIIFLENDPYSSTQKVYIINQKNGDVLKGKTILIDAFNKIEPITPKTHSYSKIIYFQMNGKVYYYKDVDINNPNHFPNIN